MKETTLSFRRLYKDKWVKTAGCCIPAWAFLFSLVAYGQNVPDRPNPYQQLLTEQVQSELWRSLLHHDPEWFASQEARRIAENILLYQRACGGWPKNIDMTLPLTEKRKRELKEFRNEPLATIDNGATYTQLAFLARLFNATQDHRFMLSFLKGLDYLLESQYENGGWPQFYPLRKGYYSHITFNDNAMAGVLQLLRAIARNDPFYDFVDASRRKSCQAAVERGIVCILRTQIRVEGQLTAWCAQYDAKTCQPARARNYELVSLSGKESVEILRFLMGLEPPSAQVIVSIQSAVSWLNRVKIHGICVIREADEKSPTGFNKVVINDPDAPPMWARFYQIGTNRPFFSDRDGKMYFDLSEISSERRNEYGWLGYWPQDLLERAYPLWQKKWAPGDNVLQFMDARSNKQK